MTHETMIQSSREPDNEAEKDTPELTVFKAVEAVLKGIEVPLSGVKLSSGQRQP